MARAQTNQTMRTRRGFLHNAAGVGAGISMASFIQIRELATPAHSAMAAAHSDEDTAAIINLATTAEMLAVTFYDTAITGATFHVGDVATEHLTMAMEAEMQHLNLLQSLGGTSLQQQFYLPSRLLSDASVFVNTGLKLETALTGVYVAATHQFAVLGQPQLAATAAQLGASEAQHFTLISHLAGLMPADLIVPTPFYSHMSDATASLAPFLTGGTGLTRAVAFPSEREHREALGKTSVAHARPFVQA